MKHLYRIPLRGWNDCECFAFVSSARQRKEAYRIAKAIGMPITEAMKNALEGNFQKLSGAEYHALDRLCPGFDWYDPYAVPKPPKPAGAEKRKKR